MRAEGTRREEGAGGGLVVANYVLAGLYALFLSVLVWKCVYRNSRGFLNFISIFILLASILTVWGHHENLTWGYQSQFYFVYMFPVVSLLLILRSLEFSGLKSDVLILSGVLFGVFSAFSMANGLIALPLLCITLILLRASPIRSAAAIALACFVIWIYLRGYKTPPMHKAFDLHSDIDAFLNYVCLYFGAPIYYVFKSKEK